MLLRVHGGAVPAGRTSAAEPSLAAREATATEAKEHIAAAALDLIPRGLGGAVHIDAGSTAARVARLLAAREDGNASLTLITNSVITASTLSHLTTPAVRVIGGRLRAVTGALVGAGAIDQIAGLRPDVAIIGTNAVNARFGLSTPDEAEAEVKRA
ncbi:MAG TPA: D-beta-D-heptose 1-phosphate adenosyltransferase, partial [Microbacterium sp.]|nr:D-beta-D-heptose 1-phosphate adenosyltransferase [Microbacterium sp.]